MTALSSDEKNLLRAGGHKATLYLSVLKPQSVFTAQVNMASPARGARSIVYDNDSGENSVLPGMTMWIGTSPGACDVGKVRVRAINTGTNTITVSENSLVWANDQYLTVKRNWELWPVYPRFDASGNFYKDFDVPYTDENEQLRPVAIMGPPRAGFDNGTETTFVFDNSAGYALRGANIISRSWDVIGPGIYSWTAGGSTQTLSISGSERFTDAHWVTLTVTDSNGKTQTTRRPVFCHERTGSNAPITAFTLESLTGDWERGGWTARLRVYSGATTSDFPDGTLVVLWHEAIYGNTPVLIGGNHPYAKNILFVGYVRGETVRQDWNTGDVTFEATTIDGLLRRTLMFSVPLKMVLGTQDQWYEFTGPTVAEAVHHYLRWHSTLFDIADVYLPTANTLRVETIEDFAKGDLYSQADNFARNHGIFAHVCCNKLGQVYVAEDAQMLNATRRDALPVVSDITAADRRGEIIILHQPEPRVGMVHLSGFAYPRTPIISKAPGDVPLDIGAQVLHYERQILASQAQANELAGRVLAAANNPYPEVRIQFAGHYLGALDIVPQEWWTLSLEAGDTPRGIVWTNKRLVCRNVSAIYDPAAGSILVDAVFEPEVVSQDGVDGDYPANPPDDNNITPPAPPVTPPQPPAASGRLAAFDHNLGHLNQTLAGTWETRNNGAVTITDNWGGFDPHWPITQNSTDIEDTILWRVQTGKIYRSTDCGRNWSQVTGMGDPPNAWDDSPAPTFANCDVVMGTPNNYRAGEWYFLVRWQNSTSNWRGWILKCTRNGEGWMWQPLGGVPYQKIDQYYYATAISDMNWDYPATWWDWNPPCPEADHYGWSDLDKIVDGDDDTYGAFWRTRAFASWRGVGWRVHFGASFKRVNGYIEVQVKYMLDGASPGYWASEPRMWADNDPYGRTYGTDWYSQSNQPDTWYVSTVSLTRYDISEWIGMDIRGYLGHTRARIAYIRIHETYFDAPAGSYGDSHPIWMDADSANGDYLYVTLWEDGVLYVKKFTTADLAIVNSVSLGAATINDITGGVYAAYPRVQEFDPNVVYVHGRLPGGYHLLRSTNAGASFSPVANEFDNASTLGFFIVGHDGILWAVENTGGTPKLWKDAGSGFVLQPAVPLSGNVRPDNMTIIPNTPILAMASDTTVIRSEDGGQTWTDQSYPSGGDIRSLLFIA